jgi:hypothetical protein
MMEDAVTGFIVYTGIEKIDFTTKSGCGNLRNANAGTCLMKNATTVKPQSVATQIIQSVPQNQQRYANAIVTSKPRLPGGKRLIKLWLNQDINRNTATTVLNTIEKFADFWDDNDLTKIKTVLNKMRNGQGITNSNKVRASQLIGKLNATTPNRSNNPVIGQKRGRNNQGNQTMVRQNNRMNINNRGNQKTATPRPNNRMNINNQGNQKTATPRSNNQGNQKTARQNNQRTNNQTPNQQNGIFARLRKRART